MATLNSKRWHCIDCATVRRQDCNEKCAAHLVCCLYTHPCQNISVKTLQLFIMDLFQKSMTVYMHCGNSS